MAVTWKKLAYFNDITATKLDDLSAPDDNTDLDASISKHGLMPKQDKNRHLRFTIINPNAAYSVDHEICIWAKTDAAITITNIEVTCDADPTTEPTGDIKYADAFIGLANAVVINDFDTANGVRSDNSITQGSISSGKCIYISFDAQPESAITQMSFDLTYHY